MNNDDIAPTGHKYLHQNRGTANIPIMKSKNIDIWKILDGLSRFGLKLVPMSMAMYLKIGVGQPRQVGEACAIGSHNPRYISPEGA